MAGLNLFSIPAGAPFLAVLAEALLAGRFGKAHDPGDPTALSRTTLYLPTQRAARALAAILSPETAAQRLAVCISVAAATPLQALSFTEIRTAEAPDETSMLTALGKSAGPV